MTTINQRIEMVRGDTKTIRVNVRNKLTKQPAVSELVGATAIWAVGTIPTAVRQTAIMTKRSGVGGITFNQNYVLIPINEADTELINPGHYYHELELRLANGSVVTAMTGEMILSGDLIVATRGLLTTAENHDTATLSGSIS